MTNYDLPPPEHESAAVNLDFALSTIKDRLIPEASEASDEDIFRFFPVVDTEYLETLRQSYSVISPISVEFSYQHHSQLEIAILMIVQKHGDPFTGQTSGTLTRVLSLKRDGELYSSQLLRITSMPDDPTVRELPAPLSNTEIALLVGATDTTTQEQVR